MIRLALDFEPFGHLEFASPLAIVAAESLADVRPVLRAVEAAAAAGRWVAGFVTYEAATAFDPALRVRPALRGPLAWFGIFDGPAPAASAGAGEARLTGLEPDVSRAEHADAVEAVRAALGRGQAYQVSLTFRLRGRFEGFFERRGDRIAVRPMKGTARRGRFTEEDDRLAAVLAASEKDRAENVMIVDLMRNDVGRIARLGTVNVAELCAVERYPTVLQMTSTVEARLSPGTSLEAIFGALFPCGSVTGAPKASAMDLIAALERSPRGVYCGAVGLVAPGGAASFNVAIRTLDLDLDTGEAIYGTGGGVTWLSSPEGEWDEALAKAMVLARPEPGFHLLETMRMDGGACERLERHLARLESSARYFGFHFDTPSIRAAIERETRAFPREPRRLRLLLSESGTAGVETAPAPTAPPGPVPVALARAPVSRDDRFLFHKTTRREIHEARRRERPEAFDVLLQNEAGELTEFTIGNLVAEIGGERLTPPREAGLLAGVFRAELLACGEVRERPLRPSDVRAARRAWLVNSLRGWVPVRLVE